MPVSLVIVSPHDALREGLSLLLARAGCHVLGSSGRVADGLALIEALRPDVALVDADLGECDGLEMTRRVRAADPDAAVVLYAASVDAVTLEGALEIGVRGLALKAGTRAELLDLLRSVADGATCVDARLGATLLPALPRRRPTVLSKREAEVIELLSRGLTGEQAAQQLVLSVQTVKTHVRNAMVKLGASTRGHAIAIAMSEGYIAGPAGELRLTRAGQPALVA